MLHFESIGGASGDMILGALIGMGVPLGELQAELRSLNIGEFTISLNEVVEQGMTGVRATVTLPEHSHSEKHSHGRHLSTILQMIEQSELPDAVKTMSAEVFRRIGEAEASVHGVDIEKIHFHEVGAMDSIVDIIGCCLGLHKLGVDGVTIRSLPQGYGTIECAHGTYPNPAPATLRLLEGFAVEPVDEPYELVTPTGAALLSSWKTADAPPAGSRPVFTVCSFGHRQLKGRPNLLRATLYETASSETLSSAETDEILVLECNLDDTTPELVGCLVDRLFESGALDVFTVPIQMKKNRPGMLLTALCVPADRKKMLDLIFAESTTFGVRERLEKRTILERSSQTVETPFGAVRVKIGKRNGETITISPEIEDCRRLAKQHRVAVSEVYKHAFMKQLKV